MTFTYTLGQVIAVQLKGSTTWNLVVTAVNPDGSYSTAVWQQVS